MAEMAAIDEAPFSQACICGQSFTDLDAFTHHQKGCGNGKKRLASALAKAKEVYQGKRARLTHSSTIFGLDDAETGPLGSSSESCGSEPLPPGLLSIRSVHEWCLIAC